MRKLSLQKKSQVDITFSIQTLSFSIHSSSVSIDTMISVIIENQSGSSFTIDVAFWDTVLTMKRRIEMTQGIPVSRQTLFFKRKLLQDHLDMFEYGIFHNSRLLLSISPDDNPTQNQVPQSPSNPIHDTMIKVIIENQSGSSFTIDVSFWDTVLMIKRKIEMTQGTPVSKQILIFKRKVLQDHLNMFGCQIRHNSRILLSISPDDNPTQNQVPQTNQSPSTPSNPIHEFVNNQDSPLSPKSSALTMEKFSKNQQDRPPLMRVVAKRIDNGSSRPSYSLDELLAPRDSSTVAVGSIRNRDQEVKNRVSSPSDSVEEVINITDSLAMKMIVMVQPYGYTRMIQVEVTADDNVEELRKELVKMQERGELNLPQGMYYLIHKHKQAVLHEDQSFLTNGVAYGDTIQISQVVERLITNRS